MCDISADMKNIFFPSSDAATELIQILTVTKIPGKTDKRLPLHPHPRKKSFSSALLTGAAGLRNHTRLFLSRFHTKPSAGEGGGKNTMRRARFEAGMRRISAAASSPRRGRASEGPSVTSLGAARCTPVQQGEERKKWTWWWRWCCWWWWWWW